MKKCAQRNKESQHELHDTLTFFKGILSTKKFTWEGNDKLVIEIMEDLMGKFEKNGMKNPKDKFRWEIERGRFC